MDNTFDNVLSSLLEQLETNPGQDIDTLISKECEKLGVSQEARKLITETNNLIDGFAEKMDSLQNAKKQGTSRKEWLLKQLDEVMEGKDESEKAKIVSAMSETAEIVNDRTLKEEE